MGGEPRVYNMMAWLFPAEMFAALLPQPRSGQRHHPRGPAEAHRRPDASAYALLMIEPVPVEELAASAAE